MSAEVESLQTFTIWRQVEHDLPGSITEELVSLAIASEHEEVCGFILDDGSIVSIANVDPNPSKGFEMDKDEMMRIIKGKKKIHATYHSHPSGREWPSEADGQHMSFLYRQGCPWRYLIVTKNGVFEFEHKDRSS